MPINPHPERPDWVDAAQLISGFPDHELEMTYSMTFKFRDDPSSTETLRANAARDYLLASNELRRRGLHSKNTGKDGAPLR